MQYLRLYADGDGETHFATATLEMSEADYRPPAPMLYVSHGYPGAFQFVRLPAGWEGRGITPPSRQFFVCLEGEVEIAASDGDTRKVKTGDVVLMEDTSGKGHRTRVTSSGDCIAGIAAIEA